MNPKAAMNQSMKNETFVITIITFPDIILVLTAM